MAILAMALVAMIASAIVAEHGAAIEQLTGRNDQAQARWLARGAIDYARNVLQYNVIRGNPLITGTSGRAGNVDFPGDEWTTPVPPLPIDEGELSGEIEELSSRFNINKLVNGGVLDTTQQAIFLSLLDKLGIPANQASALCEAIVDWIDTDDKPGPQGAETSWYGLHEQAILPPQAPLVSIDELLAVRGFTPDLLKRLRPHVTALPQNTAGINVNFATAEVLAAYIPGLTLPQAQALVIERTRSPFPTVAAFINRLPAAIRPTSSSNFDVQSYYFQATGRAHWGNATTHMQVLLYSDPGQSLRRPDIVREAIL
ncbi:MAG: ral secretion pathway protein GspK [Rhodocyclales bacterium]|nr:ral secretion pathway protein GspK [Rhodocyclales bacterium]